MSFLAPAVAFAFGLLVGSFLNVCIYRLPEGLSIVKPRSRCRSCKTPIEWYDNVPLVSFALLGGRCRSCKAAISPQYVLIEALTGLAFAAAVWRLGPTPEALVICAFLAALIVESGIDWRHRIIPDAITLPGIGIGLVCSVLLPSLQGARGPLEALGASALGVLVGGGSLYLVGTLAEKILKKEAMGGGDVKLLAMVGAFLGWQGVLWTIFISSFLGSVAGIAQKMRGGPQDIPYGPYLGMAAALYPLCGGAVIAWYLGRLTTGS